MHFELWALIIGALLVTMTLAGTWLRQLPLSTAMLYLAAGYGLGPAGLGLLTPDPLLNSVLLERVAEVAVLISLFAVGLKLGLPFSDTGWRIPLRLATVSMTVTVCLIAVIGVVGLGLSLGAAVLLGAVLAPTDPVLASDVQLTNSTDRDQLRFSLSGEGGLNDGAAFPFVMLGLGLLGLHELGTNGWRWFGVDVLWAVFGGLLIGGACGALVGRLVVHLRSRHQASVGLDEFLALGLIALAYGVALLSHTYGFLAVLAAGLALQRVQEHPWRSDRTAAREAGASRAESKEALAKDSQATSEYMMREVQNFNEQLERIAEVAVVLIVGAMLSYSYLHASAWWFVPLLLLVVRPVSVWVGLLGAAPVPRDQRIMISWFGIRGIGSIYYLMYAINHGLPGSDAEELVALTLAMVAASILVHGISVTPLMDRYARRKARLR